jgi:hypothetical protein
VSELLPLLSPPHAAARRQSVTNMNRT